MVRSKATGEYVLNLIFKNLFLHVDYPKVKGGGSDVTGDVGSASTPGKSVL